MLQQNPCYLNCCIHSVYNTSSSKTFCPNTANKYHIWFNCLPISPESHIIVISSNSSKVKAFGEYNFDYVCKKIHKFYILTLLLTKVILSSLTALT
jgi:hypothetical protein